MLRPTVFLGGSLLASVLALGDSSATATSITAAPVDPFLLYGGEIDFDVYRKGEKVGFHRVRFNGDRNDLTAQSEFSVRIDVLMIPVYRYLYRSESRWQNGVLERLNASVDDDGTPSEVIVSTHDGRIRIKAPDQSVITAPPLFPTNHWNHRVTAEDRVLNTLTGRINDVRIEPRGREDVMTERGAVTATRYSYTGDLETEVWYDAEGRWVKMRFDGKDGTPIEYICRRCQGGKQAKAGQ